MSVLVIILWIILVVGVGGVAYVFWRNFAVAKKGGQTHDPSDIEPDDRVADVPPSWQRRFKRASDKAMNFGKKGWSAGRDALNRAGRSHVARKAGAGANKGWHAFGAWFMSFSKVMRNAYMKRRWKGMREGLVDPQSDAVQRDVVRADESQSGGQEEAEATAKPDEVLEHEVAPEDDVDNGWVTDEQEKQEQLVSEHKDAGKLVVEGLRLMGRRRFADAETQFVKAIKASPKHASAYVGLGELYLKQKQYEYCVDCYSRAVKLSCVPDSKVFVNMCVAYKKLSDHDKAKEVLQQGLSYYPDNFRMKIELQSLKEAAEDADEQGGTTGE